MVKKFNEMSSLLGILDTYLRWKNYIKSGYRKYYYYHPSEFGHCLRYQQYKHYVQLGYIEIEPEELSSKQIRLFDKGHNMHNRWASYYEDMGILMGRWKCKNKSCYVFDDNGCIKKDGSIISDFDLKNIIKKNKTRIYGEDKLQGILKPSECVCGCKDFEYIENTVFSEEMNMKGQADLVLDFSKLDVKRFKGVINICNENIFSGEIIVTDLKTCNEYAFTKKLPKEGAYKEHIIQIIIYIYLLNCNYGILMYENKNDSNILWFKISRNDKVFETIKWQAKLMLEMVQDKKLPPPRPESKNCYECKKCEFANICLKSKIWKDSNLDKKRKNFYRDLL